MCRRRTASEEVCVNAENNSPEGASCSGSGRILSQECMNSIGDVWMVPNSKMEAIVSKYRLVFDACSAITDEVCHAYAAHPCFLFFDSMCACMSRVSRPV